MELVEGVSITSHARALPLTARLKLFLQLTSAVAFAHGRLLVHRDIKPANVMVDHRGQVRLLDFGIAKLLQAEEAQTASGMFYTPAYASPEQIRGDAPTVASDLFSLGVLLYQLCTDRHPFVPERIDSARQVLETVNAILQREVDRGAMRAAGLPADLQAVLQKALEKSPARRYGSVDAFATDLQAWLDGLPVQAQPPSWRYVSAKFLRRHRLAVGVSAAGLGAILGLSVWSLHSAAVAREQGALAEKRLQSVRGIANRVVFDYNRALEPISGTLEVRQMLVADALNYLEAQLADARGDLALKSEIARGFEAIGDVQGRGVSASNLGRVEDARQSYLRAHALREQVCAAAPALRVALDTAQVPSCSAEAHNQMLQADNLFSAGKSAEAIAQMDAARQHNAAVLDGLAPGDAARTAVVRLQFNLTHRVAGLSLRQTGAAYAAGLAMAEQNLPLARELAADPTVPNGRANLRDAQDFLSNRLLAAARAEEALAANGESLALSRAMYADTPTGHNAVYVMTALSNRAEIQLHLMQLDAARTTALEALDLARRTHEADPQDALLRARYANVGRRSGWLLNQLDTPEAHREAASLMAAVAEVSGTFTPADGVFWFQHQQVVLQQAVAAHALGELDQAERLLAMFPAAAPDPRAALDLAEVQILRARLLVDRSQIDAAHQALEPALTALQARAESTPADLMNRALLAQTCQWAGEQPALATNPPPYRECGQTAAVELDRAGQLTPWWRARLLGG
jgi:serine/threonine-protein kinase